MSSCEKCWRDAHAGPYADVAGEYRRLIEQRKDNPCSPEDQAGPDARPCPLCYGMTVHQWTGECMHPRCSYKELEP